MTTEEIKQVKTTFPYGLKKVMNIASLGSNCIAVFHCVGKFSCHKRRYLYLYASSEFGGPITPLSLINSTNRCSNSFQERLLVLLVFIFTGNWIQMYNYIGIVIGSIIASIR